MKPPRSSLSEATPEPASWLPPPPPLTQQNQHNTIPPQKHLTYKPIPVHRPPHLSIRLPWRLRPHLLDVLEHHIAVAIERLHPRQQLPVIAAGYQHLRVGGDGGLEDAEGTGAELVFFELGNLVFGELLGRVGRLAGG